MNFELAVLTVNHIALIPRRFKVLGEPGPAKSIVVWWRPPFKLIYLKLFIFLTSCSFLLWPIAFHVEFIHQHAAPVSQVSSFVRTHCTENHLSIECRESSATSVLLEVDFDSFLSLMNFLYFHVVSGNTFFFFHLLWSQSFCSWWSENCACRPTDLKENCGMELCLNFVCFFFFLSIISLLVWQVQEPGVGLNSAKQIHKCI